MQQMIEAVKMDRIPKVRRPIQYWAGYTFGMPLGETTPYAAGVVVTWRWAHRLAGEKGDWPVMLDNDAYPAFRDGRELPFRDQLDGIHRGVEALGLDRIRWIIMPDKVGDAKESWKRCIYSMPELEQYDSRRWLLPVQNGQDIGLAVDFALAHGCGLFIGGMTIDGPKKQWKHETVAKIRDISKRVYVHVGSLSAAKDLKRACAAGVESYDTTTYLMNVGWNARQDWMPRMKRFVERDATIVMPEEMQ